MHCRTRRAGQGAISAAVPRSGPLSPTTLRAVVSERSESLNCEAAILL